MLKVKILQLDEGQLQELEKGADKRLNFINHECSDLIQNCLRQWVEACFVKEDGNKLDCAEIAYLLQSTGVKTQADALICFSMQNRLYELSSELREYFISQFNSDYALELSNLDVNSSRAH